MDQQSNSPFFPVPVRWFEIPMTTPRWGLARLLEASRATRSGDPSVEATENPLPAAQQTGREEFDSGSRVGRILDERA